MRFFNSFFGKYKNIARQAPIEACQMVIVLLILLGLVNIGIEINGLRARVTLWSWSQFLYLPLLNETCANNTRRSVLKTWSKQTFTIEQLALKCQHRTCSKNSEPLDAS